MTWVDWLLRLADLKDPEPAPEPPPLVKYGRHFDDCYWHSPGYMGARICTCGFDDALREERRASD